MKTSRSPGISVEGRSNTTEFLPESLLILSTKISLSNAILPLAIAGAAMIAERTVNILNSLRIMA